MKCIVHPAIEAATFIQVPCAADGKIHVCGECALPQNLARVFRAYQEAHGIRIEGHKHRAKEGSFGKS